MTLNAILITGRTINQGATIENKTSSDYQKATAYCELSPKDIQTLGASSGSRVSVKTDHGDIVVQLKENKGNPDGLAFIPMGPWANSVVNPDTSGCGMPNFKGVPARIDTTDEKILSMKELMARYK